ncbi:MAG: transglutaminase-like cysteine peptidase, partial [Methylobacterium sp.]
MRAGLLKAVRGAAVAALALAGVATAAEAQVLANLPTEPGLVPKAEARPIAAWVTFCEAYADECAVDRNEPARIALTPSIWTSIVTINRRINKAVEPMTDMEHLHVA